MLKSSELHKAMHRGEQGILQHVHACMQISHIISLFATCVYVSWHCMQGHTQGRLAKGSRGGRAGQAAAGPGSAKLHAGKS